MSNWGHVEKITRTVGGKLITFRSKGEYRWCVWCQVRKEQGLIQDWWYEDEILDLETTIFKNKKLYLPDFIILNNEGIYELEEFKGYFQQKDYTKLKLAAQQYENPITLIFANLKSDSKSKTIRAQYARAKRLEPFLKRIIYDVDKTIFKQIKGFFEN